MKSGEATEPAAIRPTLAICAIVHERERPVFCRASELLANALGTALGRPFPVRLEFRGAAKDIDFDPSSTVVILSMLAEIVASEVPQEAVDVRLRREILRLRSHPLAGVFLCTLFRHVAGAGERSRLLERIRRLNLLATEISHDARIGIIDLDRIFAHVGARALQTDYQLSGESAIQAAATIVTRTLLAHGMHAEVPSDVRQRALETLSGSPGAIAGP